MARWFSGRGGRWTAPWLVLWCLLTVSFCGLGAISLLGTACSSTPALRNSMTREAPYEIPGIPIGDGHTVGVAFHFDNLSVFPIYARSPEDLGEFTTLEAAISAGTAEVREITPGSIDARGEGQSDGARVDTLVIENKGKLPILVLAGTVVKGGKQDRQLGEDLVVRPSTVVDIAAFCVEQGRWNGTREGASTGGKFTAQKSLAVGKVRAAGQYERNQGKVWASVETVNEATKKESSSGTLLATLDDEDLTRQREETATKVKAELDTVAPQSHVVGIAYAVDGEVRGVRWFAGPQLFALHRDTLLQTAAIEAITAKAGRAGNPPAKPEAVQPAHVAAFVEHMETRAVAELKQADGQTKSYKNGDEGFASEVMMDDGKETSKSPAGKPRSKKSVTKDFFKK